MAGISILATNSNHSEECWQDATQNRVSRYENNFTSRKITKCCPTERNSLSTEESPTILELARYCASTVIQTHARGFLQRISKRKTTSQENCWIQSDASTHIEVTTRLANVNPQIDDFRKTFIEKSLNHLYSKPWQLSYREVVHLLKATMIITPQEHENLINSNYEPFEINNSFRVRLFSNVVAFQYDLVQACYSIKKRDMCASMLAVSAHDDGLFFDDKIQIFKDIQRQFQIPSKAIKTLLGHKTIHEYSSGVIETFLNALDDGFSGTCEASLKKAIEQRFTKSNDIVITIRLRVAYQLIQSLSVWETSSHNDTCILIAEIQDELQRMSKTLDQAWVIISDQNTKINSKKFPSVTFEWAANQETNESLNFTTEPCSNVRETKKSNRKFPHHTNKNVVIPSQLHQCKTAESVPMLSKVDITFEENKSVISFSKPGTSKFQQNIRTSSSRNRPLAETAQKTQKKRTQTNQVSKQKNSMHDEKMDEFDSQKRSDIYKNANMKLNSILEKFNSKSFDNF